MGSGRSSGSWASSRNRARPRWSAAFTDGMLLSMTLPISCSEYRGGARWR
jgi:hypothetical protein